MGLWEGGRQGLHEGDWQPWHCMAGSLLSHTALLTFDGLEGTNRESAFSLLLLGTCCWELVTNKGKIQSNQCQFVKPLAVAC